MAAHLALLAQPELLCKILLELPQQHLLLVQRVCRTWRDVISRSNALQTALFLRPDTASRARVEKQSDDEDDDDSPAPIVEFNPLLRDRFPAFFDHDKHAPKNRRGGSNLGPWEYTHWYRGCAMSKHPFRGQEARRRSEAYARAEASWRRMIPCRPAPTELQVLSERETMGSESFEGATLRCLRFSNQQEAAELHRSCDEESIEKPTRPIWLQFGLLYDIVERFWFGRGATGHDHFIVDMTYEEPVHREVHNPIWKAGAADISDTSSELEGPDVLYNDLKLNLRRVLPGKTIGGPGKILVYLAVLVQCTIGGYELDMKVYRNQFRSRGEAGDVEWDEVFKI